MNILITGASGDIGLATARVLAKGNRLILVGNKNIEKLNELKKELKESCVSIHTVDLEKKEEIDRLFKELTVHIDAYVHLAGISYVNIYQLMSYEDIQRILNTNLVSAMYICNRLIPGMIENRFGKIILGSSIWGRVGASTEVAYSVSKGALDTFAKALGKEAAPCNIAVNSIDFGMINTKMNDIFSEDEKKEIEDEIPAGYMASVSHCGKLIKNLLETDTYFTCNNLRFDGGWY